MPKNKGFASEKSPFSGVFFERLCYRHIVSQEKEKKKLARKKHILEDLCAAMKSCSLFTLWVCWFLMDLPTMGQILLSLAFLGDMSASVYVSKFMGKESNLVFLIKRSGPVEVAVQQRRVDLCYYIGHLMFLEPSVLFVKPLFPISSRICLGFSFLMCILGSLPSRTIVNSIIL